jgi:hypothetical protein
MRFLDIDLDFFLDGIAHCPEPGRRLSGKDYTPWGTKRVREFLEKQCRLARGNRIPGRFVRDHDAAFDHWEALRRQTSRPFTLDVTHVDAHADLGFGDASWKHLMTDILHQPVANRVKAARGQNRLSLASYLVYAAACRWLSSVEYVHPDGKPNDLAWLHFQNFDPASGYLELKAYPTSDVDTCIKHGDLKACMQKLTASAIEPLIPFVVRDGRSWVASDPFDRALLCHSPEFTPRAADALIGVFSEYIDFR